MDYVGGFMPAETNGLGSPNLPRQLASVCSIMVWHDGTRQDPSQISIYGLPVIMEISKFGAVGSDTPSSSKTPNGDQEWETVLFNVSTSYFIYPAATGRSRRVLSSSTSVVTRR